MNGHRPVDVGRHLVNVVAEKHPALLDREADHEAVIEQIDGLEVVWQKQPYPGACELGGYYDDSVSPPRIIIRNSSFEPRDRFTLLHEFGHHLLRNDSLWANTVFPSLSNPERQQAFEEEVVNHFAAEVLLPRELYGDVQNKPVTAEAVRDLYLRSRASKSAVVVGMSSLVEVGTVMLTNRFGQPVIKVRQGDSPSPPLGLRQPLIERAISGASSEGVGLAANGEGIRYLGGSADTGVRIEVANIEGHEYSFVLASPVKVSDQDLRWDTWNEDCPQCDASFSPSNEDGVCIACGLVRCRYCRSCECSAKTFSLCQECFLELPTALASAGATRHEEC